MALSLIPVQNADSELNFQALGSELGRLKASNSAGLAPSYPTIGQLWFDTTTNALKYYNNSRTAITLGAGSGTVTSISAGTGITLTPNPIVATGSVALTTPVTEILGGTNQTAYVLGDTLYASAANTLSKLAGNTTSTKKFLNQTGTGTVSAAPAWSALVSGDIPQLAHSSLSGLTSGDDHTQYALLAGRSGGQVLELGNATATITGKTLTVADTNSPTHTATGKGVATSFSGTNGFYIKETGSTVESKFENTTTGVSLGVISNHDLSLYANNTAYVSLTRAGLLSHTASGQTALFGDTGASSSARFGTVETFVDDGAALASGDGTGQYIFGGSFDTTHTIGTGALIKALTTQLWSSSALGSKLVFQTVPNSSTTLTTAVTIDQDKSVTLAGLGTGIVHSSSVGLLSSSAVVLTSSTEATAAWSTFTPTWTSSGTAVALGNGTLTGRYIQIGKIVFFSINLTMGSTTTYGTGTYSFALPVTISSSAPARYPIGVAECLDAGTAAYNANAVAYSTTKVDVAVWNTTGTYGVSNQAGQTVPFTFGNTDQINISGTYEAA